MKIIRAEINDTDIFNESELDFGACCFFTEDKRYKYFSKLRAWKQRFLPIPINI